MFFTTTSGLAVKRPQNSFNELGSVFVTVTLTAADVFILFQWRNVKMYEYMEKNVYEGCYDKTIVLKALEDVYTSGIIAEILM